ncbi:hypothetical protein K501DRAFT_289365 [Backusella circina FSU 941]|nr:hypothetical protein K501DRAFT_289365 [Backusella circina FSU 941]
MEELPSLRNQVMNLSVTRTQRSDDRRRVLALFPNLRKIEMRSKYAQSYSDDSKDVDATILKNRIELIRDVGGCELTRTMAKFKRCYYLTDLDLNLEVLASSNINVFAELQNMPALKRLVLRNSLLKASDLSTLHANIPSIETLKLEKTLFENDSIADITPVVSITTLVFTSDFIDGDKVGFLSFASEKYPELRHFSYQVHAEYCEDNYWPLFVSQKHQQTDHYSYRLHHVLYDYDDTRTLNLFYNIGYRPILNCLGTSLKSLDLRGAEFSGYKVFEKMDEVGCQINKLVLNSDMDNTLLSILSTSNQAKFLKELSILALRPCSFEWLENLTKLNSLELSYKYDSELIENFGVEPVCLRMLLESCSSTVRSIKLECALLDLKITPKVTFSIEKLALRCSVKPSDLDLFITNCLPDLNSLYLKECIRKGGILNLSNHRLRAFHLFITGHIISLSISNHDKPLLYNTHDGKLHVATPPSDRYITPMKDSDVKVTPHATVIVHSAKTIYFNDRPVLF